MTSTVAHELRTLLTNVLAYTELLMKDLVPKNMREMAFEVVINKTKLLINIINEMLDLARIEPSNSMNLKIMPYPVGELITKILSSY